MISGRGMTVTSLEDFRQCKMHLMLGVLLHFIEDLKNTSQHQVSFLPLARLTTQMFTKLNPHICSLSGCRTLIWANIAWEDVIQQEFHLEQCQWWNVILPHICSARPLWNWKSWSAALRTELRWEDVNSRNIKTSTENEKHSGRINHTLYVHDFRTVFSRSLSLFCSFK